MNPFEAVVDKVKHDVQVLVWRLTAQNALRVLAELDADNAANYRAAIEAMK
jgi:hypothetical protein